MALVLHILVEGISRLMSNREAVAGPKVDAAEFFKACSKICRCDTLEELIECSKSLLSTLLSPQKPILAFHRTKNYCHRDSSNNVIYCAKLINLTVSEKTWQAVRLKKDDELVAANFFEDGDLIVILPIYPENKERYELVFVSGPIAPVSNAELLNLLHNHISSSFSRIYRHFQLRDEREGFLTALFKLCADLGQLGAADMQVKVMKYLSRELSCEKCCLLIVDDDVKNFSCQVVGDQILECEYYCPFSGFFGNISRSRQSRIMMQFTTAEQTALRDLFKVNVKSFLCVPIPANSHQKQVSMLCAANKLKDQRFTVSDVEDVQTCLRYTWTLLASSLALQKETKAKDECQAMLQIAKNLFTHLDDVTILLGEIMQEARTLTNAERCSVFLVNNERNELVAKVFDGIVAVDEGMSEVRIPLTRGIAGHVATTGQTLNIADAYSHPLFYRGIDDETGFKTRNILCFPIKDDVGNVVGVSQLCNKIKGHSFTQYDVELAERFAVFSGISISHSLLYKQVFEVQCRNQLANELMTYHMKIGFEEVDKCLDDLPRDVTRFAPDFNKFSHVPRNLPDDSKCTACIEMYVDLDLVEKFKINTRTLAKFVLMVKSGYRDPPYHNWDHAYSVAHQAYLFAKNLQLEEVFGPIEVLALLTGSLCHDIDHRGTNNAFQISSKSTLAALYSSQGSVLEQHHFAQALSILNSGSCNIFENMSNADYVKVLDLIKEIILATDLGRHLNILPELEKMANEGKNPAEYGSTEKLKILNLCMTACDLSDQTKDWKNTKNTAKIIYKEFFHQGDIEKSMGALPALINDRERACVPELQINFMEHIAGPVYKVLAKFFPECGEVYERYKLNLARWKLVLEKFNELRIPCTDSLDFLTEEFDKDLFPDDLS